MTLSPKIAAHLEKKQFFNFQVRAEDIDQENRTVSLSFSSETPIDLGWYIQILSHDPAAMRLDRLNNGGAFLVNHDPDDQVAVFESARCNTTKKKGEGTIRFGRSARAEEILQDMIDGIRRNTSVGFMVHSAQELKPDEMTDELKNLALERKVPVVLVDSWEPLEVSVVAIPRDVSVGVGRSFDSANGAESAVTVNTSTDSITINERGAADMGDTLNKQTAPEPAPAVDKQEVLREERERLTEIKATTKRWVGRLNDVDKLETEAVNKGWSVERYRGEIALRFVAQEPSKPIDVPPSQLNLTEKEKRQYSLTNIIRSKMGVPVDISFEQECSDEIAKRSGRAPNGIFIPFDIQLREVNIPAYAAPAMYRRDLTVGTPTAGGNLVATNLLASSFIDLLRNRMVMAQAGVVMLPGLVGDVAIPRQTAGGTFSFVAEGNAANESAQTFDQVTMAPKLGNGYTDISRKLILQSTPAIEGLITADLVKIAGLGIDYACLHGPGTNSPTGIVGQSGVGTVTAAGFNWAAGVEYETDVASANADVATMKFVMGAAARGLLKTRPLEAGYPKYIIENNELNGYPVLVTNQASSGYVFFGDWSQAMIGEWGGLDLLVDPYTGSTAGTIRIVVYVAVDFAVRHAAAFSYSSDLS